MEAESGAIWAIKAPNGEIILSSIRKQRSAAWSEVVGFMPSDSVIAMLHRRAIKERLAQGYRAVLIRIVEVE